MTHGSLRIGAVIPARDEQENIGLVVADLKSLRLCTDRHFIDDIVVCDNGSLDRTAECASRAGARVVTQPEPGYGIACLTAIAALQPVDVVLFVDGDRAFDVTQSVLLLDRIVDGADLVIGSRTLGRMESGALSLPQIVGNRVAGLLIRLLWKERVTDLGPFRAIRTVALTKLAMADHTFGWTIEMQIKAIQSEMRVEEVPVDTMRRRHGVSKVGGTVKGVIFASIGILGMIVRLWLRPIRRGNLT